MLNQSINRPTGKIRCTRGRAIRLRSCCYLTEDLTIKGRLNKELYGIYLIYL